MVVSRVLWKKLMRYSCDGARGRGEIHDKFVGYLHTAPDCVYPIFQGTDYMGDPKE